MRSISAWPGLFLLLLGATATAAPAVPWPEVELSDPQVVIEWAWIVPGPGGEGEQLVPAAPGEPAPAAAGEEPPLRLGTVRFRYSGARAAELLHVTVTVPADLDYVPDSATGPGAATEYLAAERRLRWTLEGPIEPGTTGLVSFRARVAQPVPGPGAAAEEP